MRGASVSSTGGGGIGSTVTMGAGLPLWIPYCTQSDRRVSTSSNEFSGRGECLKLIRELNRETSHHRHLAVGLGGSGDCERLRDELKRSRRRAQDLARQAKLKLDPHLQETGDVAHPNSPTHLHPPRGSNRSHQHGRARVRPGVSGWGARRPHGPPPRRQTRPRESRGQPTPQRTHRPEKSDKRHGGKSGHEALDLGGNKRETNPGGHWRRLDFVSGDERRFRAFGHGIGGRRQRNKCLSAPLFLLDHDHHFRPPGVHFRRNIHRHRLITPS
nr:uncharacterized protein LOC113826506 [Penaeus vannamei]